MRKLGDIARSQDQTDIGVNNEIAGAGHSIGVAGFSDLNVGNDFVNVLKVDLSDKDTDDVARKGLNVSITTASVIAGATRKSLLSSNLYSCESPLRIISRLFVAALIRVSIS